MSSGGCTASCKRGRELMTASGGLFVYASKKVASVEYNIKVRLGKRTKHHAKTALQI